jgi:hypothetical protein
MYKDSKCWFNQQTWGFSWWFKQQKNIYGDLSNHQWGYSRDIGNHKGMKNHVWTTENSDLIQPWKKCDLAADRIIEKKDKEILQLIEQKRRSDALTFFSIILFSSIFIFFYISVGGYNSEGICHGLPKIQAWTLSTVIDKNIIFGR